jgi:hypothetical protein
MKGIVLMDEYMRLNIPYPKQLKKLKKLWCKLFGHKVVRHYDWAGGTHDECMCCNAWDSKATLGPTIINEHGIFRQSRVVLKHDCLRLPIPNFAFDLKTMQLWGERRKK